MQQFFMFRIFQNLPPKSAGEDLIVDQMSNEPYDYFNGMYIY